MPYRTIETFTTEFGAAAVATGKDRSRIAASPLAAVVCISLALALLVCPAWGETKVPSGAMVLRGGTVFDAHTGAMVPAQTIVISGDRIERVIPDSTAFEPPAGSQVMDVRGKYIIPGLIDGHVHITHQLNLAHMTGDEVFPLFLAAGVTSVRDVGDTITTQKLLARYAEANSGSCPRVFMCSPLIDGSQPFHQDIGWAVPDPEKVPDFVADMAAWGVTTLKLYVGTERPVGKRIIEEGHKHGLMVTAHLGLYSAQDAVADGIDCLEHIWSVFDYIIPDGPRPEGYRSSMDLTTPKAQDLINSIAQHNVRVNPTLTIFRNSLLLTDLETVWKNPDLAHVPARLQRRWEAHRAGQDLKPESFDLRKREFDKYQELTGILHRARITILAGTDTPEPYVIPGFALLDELERLVESGLTPAAALQAATINNAGMLKQEAQLGSVTPGKLADLVVLSADPLDDIRNVRQIERVIRGGIACDPQELFKLVPTE